MSAKTTPDDEGKKKKAAHGRKKPDLTKAKALADEIAEYGPNGNLLGLVHRYESEEGLKVSRLKKGLSNKIQMAGVVVVTNANLPGALHVWGNAARRACLKGRGA